MNYFTQPIVPVARSNQPILMNIFCCLCGYREEHPEGSPIPACPKCGDLMFRYKALAQ